MSTVVDLPREIRGVMLPVTGGRVLVPNTTMAEVITYAQPEPVANAPAWLLGRLTWRGWGLPVLAFSSLVGVAGGGEATENARVAILKALNGHPRLPYFGVLSQGFPRLTLISETIMRPDDEAGPLPTGVREQVIVHDETAWVPDLAVLEGMLVEALTIAA